MKVVVEGADVTLESPEDCGRFHVEVRGESDVAAALDSSGAGQLAADGEHAHIEIGWVRQAATGRVDPDWDQQFGAMVDYARTKGWIDEGDAAIVAHLERV